MNDTKIKLTINGKSAELSIEDAREMFCQLKAIFGEPVAPIAIPYAVPQTPTLPHDPTPWLPRVWCRAGDDQCNLTATQGQLKC